MDDARWARFERKREAIGKEQQRLRDTWIRPADIGAEQALLFAIAFHQLDTRFVTARLWLDWTAGLGITLPTAQDVKYTADIVDTITFEGLPGFTNERSILVELQGSNET